MVLHELENKSPWPRISGGPIPWADLAVVEELSSGGFFVGTSCSLFTFALLLVAYCAKALNVACHHGRGDVTLESVEAMIRATVKARHFQRVDGRFHRRMTAVQTDALGGGSPGKRGSVSDERSATTPAKA